jgi:U4/U6.U5 tri-snRNP-associated protein 2
MASDGDDSDSDAPLSFKARRRAREASGRDAATLCPYLDTVTRRNLDFDIEKVCSVTLSSHNVYACLVCGVFFGGRGRATPAYAHAVEAGHFVWVGVTPPEGGSAGEGDAAWTPRFWCLPDGYEILDASLDDIRAALRPRFTAADIRALDGASALGADATGTPFLPGYLGVNNLGSTDGLSSAALMLAQ